MNSANRFFQWIAGDNRGQVEIFDTTEEEDNNFFIVFKSGNRVDERYVAPLNVKSVTGMFVAEIDSPDNCWQFKEEYVGREEEKWAENADGQKVCVSPFNPGKKVIKLIPPRSVIKKEFEHLKATPSIDSLSLKKEEVVSNDGVPSLNDPIYIILDKSKKQDKEIVMGLTVSLPSIDLYNLAKNSFDDGDNKIISYIVENITVDIIKESLKIAIKNMYEDNNKNL